jgi:hypothetical protein
MIQDDNSNISSFISRGGSHSSNVKIPPTAMITENNDNSHIEISVATTDDSNHSTNHNGGNNSSSNNSNIPTTTILPMHRTQNTSNHRYRLQQQATPSISVLRNSPTTSSTTKQMKRKKRIFMIRFCPTRIWQHRYCKVIRHKLTLIGCCCSYNSILPESIVTFQCTKQHIMDVIVDISSYLLEWFIYYIGPLLIVLALGIVTLLAYTFFGIILPMIYLKHQLLHPIYQSMIITCHCTIVIILLINVLFNYICCVIQKHVGYHYDTVLYELASITNTKLPSNNQELVQYRRELSGKLTQRMKQHHQYHHQQQQRARQLQQKCTDGNTINSHSNELTQRRTVTTISNPDPLAVTASSTSNESTCNNNASIQQQLQQQSTTVRNNNDTVQSPSIAVVLSKTTPTNTALPTTTTTIPSNTNTNNNNTLRTWMLLGPYEWGYCSQNQQIKPPRSHYDHVSKLLILNFDHYCPWMFNAGNVTFLSLHIFLLLVAPNLTRTIS